MDVTDPVSILGEELYKIRFACCGMKRIQEEADLLRFHLVR